MFEQVTAGLVAAIEAGASDWRMPWQLLAAGGVPRRVAGVGDHDELEDPDTATTLWPGDY